MIRAEFYRDSSDKLKGFRVSGHAGYAEYGQDIACASVSSAVMLTANTVTEIFKIKARVTVEENDISLLTEADENGDGDRLLLGLLTHLSLISDEFPGRIKITFTEV
ncbi:MAG: ribosomal-processing cysteine protease Prp [Ruminococcus sp.]|nr:ribosomal-processing cysteine protease Prp [Ruminococcus sp.]